MSFSDPYKIDRFDPVGAPTEDVDAMRTPSWPGQLARTKSRRETSSNGNEENI